MTNKTIDVRLADGATVKTVPTVWSGQHLAVHRPLNSKEPDGLSKASRYWSVSHKATGYLAGPSLNAAQRFEGMTCQRCQLCQARPSNVAVVFRAHGNGRRKVETVIANL